MIPGRMMGRFLVLILIVISVAYLPPPAEKDWLGERGLSFVRALPSTLHVTHLKAPLFRAATVLLGAILLVRVLREKRLLAPTREELLLLALVFLYAVSIFWAQWPRGWLIQWVHVFFAGLWAIIIARVAAREQCEATVVKGIAAAGIATAAFGLIAFLVMGVRNPGMMADPTFRLAVPHRSNPNFTACILIPPMLMMWYGGVGGGRRKALWIPLAVLLTVALVLTRSASGFIGLGVAMITLCTLCIQGKWRWRIGAISIGLIATAGLVIASVPGLTARCVGFCLEGTRALRCFFWQDAWRMIREKPLLGWGGGGFFYAYPQFRQPEEFLYPALRKIVGDHAHNELLNIGVELGLMGMIAAGAFVAFLIWRASKGMGEGAERRWRQALLAGTIGMLVQSGFSPSLRSWDVAPFFWTQIGLLMALARRGRGAEPRWMECGIICRITCIAVLAVSAVGGGIACYRDWRGEVLLARGMTLNVREKEVARAAGPYLDRGAGLIMNPAYWFNGTYRYAICLRVEGRPDDAIRVLKGIDREVPNLGTTRLYLGELYFARFLQGGVLTDHAKALSGFNDYLSANADAGVYLKTAKVLLKGKPRPETVIHYLTKCLDLGPTEAQKAEAEQLLREVQ